MATKEWNTESRTRYEYVCSLLDTLLQEEETLKDNIGRLCEEKRAWESLQLTYGKEAR